MTGKKNIQKKFKILKANIKIVRRYTYKKILTQEIAKLLQK